MEQIPDFDRLNVSDSPGEKFANEEQIKTQDYTEPASNPIERESDNKNDDFEQLIISHGGSDETEYNKLAFGNPTVFNQMLEQQAINQNPTASFGNDVTVAGDKYPPDSIQKYGLNRWSQFSADPNLYIRNQNRMRTEKRDISECDVRLTDLPSGNLVTSPDNKSFWYHATNWKSAQRIIESKPKIASKPSDLAPEGAFYLNPSYAHCYDWLYTKKGSFEGEHSILVFKFDPWELSKKGEELTIDEWKKLVQKRNTGRCILDWSLAYINSSPDKFHEQGKHPKACQMSDGKTAKQLVVRSQNMCNEMHRRLVGCVFYEKMDNDASASSAEKFCSETGPIDTQNTSENRSRNSNHSRNKRQKREDQSESRKYKKAKKN